MSKAQQFITVSHKFDGCVIQLAAGRVEGGPVGTIYLQYRPENAGETFSFKGTIDTAPLFKWVDDHFPAAAGAIAYAALSHIEDVVRIMALQGGE